MVGCEQWHTHSGRHGESDVQSSQQGTITHRAGDRTRTGDNQLGKLALYQLSYARENTWIALTELSLTSVRCRWQEVGGRWPCLYYAWASSIGLFSEIPITPAAAHLNIFPLLLLVAVVGAPTAGPDTLVVCPNEFRPALVEWESYRRAQGHEVVFVAPAASAEQMRATIRRVAEPGRLKYVLLIGDEAVWRRPQRTSAGAIVPTNYVPAKVNIRWGSEPEIASDTPYADIDGDNRPDLAIGRIPAHSTQELAAVVRKVLRYERQTGHGTWEKSLSIVSGVGGFGAVADAMVEGAGRQIIQQTVPPQYDVRHIFAGAASTNDKSQPDFGTRARRELSGGGLAWIYVGHGLPTELDRTQTLNGRQPILSTRDVPALHCGPHNPLAVLISCYTGAMDAPHGCLAEDLLLADEGPVAVIAATRVTMPYGNTVIGYELLRSCFQDRPNELGDILRIAQRRVLTPMPNDSMRSTLDGMAGMLSPPPVDLPGELREHVLMYQLIGDPLLRLHRPVDEVAKGKETAQVR